MTYFPRTLWHGTSAHLLPMIKKHGLGGRNAMSQLRIMDFIQEAFPHVGFDDTDFSNPDYMDLLPVQAAVRGGATGMNFEYGDLYVTGGYHKAAIYAQSAPELVSFAKTIIEIGRRESNNAIEDALADFPDAKDFLGLSYAPIVLKLPKLPIDRVEDERGCPLTFSDMLEDRVSEAKMSQRAFRVKGVVPFNELEVIEVEKATINDVAQ